MRSLLLVAASFVVPLAAQGDTCSGLQLKALAEVPVGTTPSALASGDWNRDGRLDLAVANRGSKDVSILLGDGAGGFAAASGSPVGVAGNPIDVAVADLDHDGFQDLVVAFDSSPTTVQVLKGQAGGSFASAGTTLLGPGPGPVPTRILLGQFTSDASYDLVVLFDAAQRIGLYGGSGLGFGTTPIVDLDTAGETNDGGTLVDFNRDGKLDVAVAVASRDLVRVYFGDGSGRLTAGPSAGTGGDPVDVAAGDVNRDGWPDLVTADRGAGTASVFEGAPGGTTLAFKGTRAVGSRPTRVALSDLDHDGILDLAVLDASATPRLTGFKGEKTAPYFDPAAYPADLAPGADPLGLAVGPFTADGRDDVAVAYSSLRQVVVVEDQSGMPCVRASFAGAPRSYPAGNGPVASAAADFDHDGRSDLVVASANDTSLRILRNVDGGFSAGTVITGLSPAPRAVAVGDMNVDGHPDVVVALGAPGSGKVQLYLGNGAGGLAPGVSQPAGDNTSAVVVGDVNGDGAPDVVAASETTGQVFVFLGNGAGGLGPGAPVTVGAGPRALVAAFLDANGTLDLAIANALTNNVTILSGNGDGTFVTTATLAVGLGPQGIAAADLDADGRQDLVTADNGSSQVSVILRSGTGGYQPAVPYAVGVGPTAIALANFEGDAKPDIAVTTFGTESLKLLVNSGSGTFPSQSDHTIRNSPQAITPIDADTDGLLDLAIPCRSADAVVVLMNRPPGPPVLQSAPRVAVHRAPRAAIAGDFDANGTLDMAVANSGSDNVSLLRGDGLGGFTEYDALGVAAPEAIAAGDWNGDGRLDLAVSSASSGRVAIFLGSTTVPGKFDTPPAIVGAGTRPDDLVAGDFDGDGDLDLAVCDKSSPGFVQLLRNTGGVFSAGQSITVGKAPTAIVAADFDRDGDVDLAVANDDADNVMVLLNAGGSFDASQTYPLPGGDSSPVSLTAADFDGDGTVDLAVAAGDNDRLHVFKNGGSSFAPATQLDVPYVVRFVTTSDLNRDGRPDLIAVADGLAYLRGRGGLGFDPPQTVVARYKPSAAVVADFDRDGRNDVVVLDEDSDEISILKSTACQQQRLEVSVQPNACSAGAPPFPFDAAVTAFDDGDNVAGCASGSVARSIVPGTGDASAVLGGPPSLGFSAGIAAFTGPNGLTLDKPGRYKLAFQTAGLPPVQTRSFTLGQPAPLQILGPDSVCPAGSGTYTLNQSFDTYAWTLTPPGGSPSLFTPAVNLGPPLSGARQLDVVGRNECVASASRSIFFGNLASVSLNITGVSSVCVDCIGGSAKAVELGGGAIGSRQWGYRILSGGAITSLPGELGDSYVLKGASFPGPGTYFVVVTSTPTCGTATISAEWTVTVVASVPTGEVQHLAASSRGTSTSGENQLLWVNATGAAQEIRIRWDQAPAGTSSCLPPASISAPFDGEAVIAAPSGGMRDGYLHAGVLIDTAYCYSVFVKVSGVYSAGRTIKARAFDATTRPGHSVKWAYATGGTAVAPPTVSVPGILAMSNDRTVHELTRGSAGGLWPAPWLPTDLVGVAHSRSPVVPFTIPIAGSDTVLFAADDATPGFVHAIDARTGQRPWPAQSQGFPMTGAPGGIFTAFGGALDALLVGTRNGGGNNELHALKLADGTPLASYAPGSAPGPIGPINGTPTIDYATRRVYFASLAGGGDTLFCLELNA
ncbi:MAG: FG-GAP repeat domain-containing protein, partial [Burkholderiales bacterium]